MTKVTLNPKARQRLDVLFEIQEDLYDADQALGAVRITKETAAALSLGLDKVHEADLKVTKMIEGWDS